MDDSERKAMLMVMLECEDGWEQEFNQWYDEEHLPERLACPGFLSAKRYRAIEGKPRFLATYELESLDALKSEQYLALREGTEWTKRMRPHKGGLVRHVYVDITAPVKPYLGPRKL